MNEARRRYRTHNAGRRFVENEVFAELAQSGRDELAPSEVRSASGAIPRSAKPWSGCGPCSRRPSSSTTSSGRRALLRHAGRNLMTDDESAGPAPASQRHVDDVMWTPTTPRCSTRPAPCSAPSPAAADRGRADGRRRDPHLRPHRGRRGAGPLAHAAADAEPPIAQRLHDRGGRHRPGHRRVGARRRGTRSSNVSPIAAPPVAPSSPSATGSPAPIMELAARVLRHAGAGDHPAPLGARGRGRTRDRACAAGGSRHRGRGRHAGRASARSTPGTWP